MSTASTTNTTRLGIAYMLVAILMFSLNDALGKWLVASYSVGQVLVVRSLAALAILLPFILAAGWRSVFQIERPWLMALRVCLTTIEISAFYHAVSSMPLANAITFWMAAPIYVAALSPLLLGEHVGWRRWTAIGIGFVGVLIALEPSGDMLKASSLLAIAGSVAFGLMMITGRALRNSSDIALVFWPTAGALVFGALTSLTVWNPPSAFDYGLLALLGVVAMAAHFFTNRSLILADATVVTPYQYTLLVWAALFGWLFFGEIPRMTTLIGAALIVASGLFIFFREQQLGKKPAEPAVEK